jgi:hypothetical protein
MEAVAFLVVNLLDHPITFNVSNLLHRKYDSILLPQNEFLPSVIGLPKDAN